MIHNVTPPDSLDSEPPVIFTARNNHFPSCGKPPAIAAKPTECYTGYFENQFGEQAIFVYDFKEKQGVLYMGDAGWENAYPVVDGMVDDLILGDHEKTWLLACWCAATREKAIEVMKRRGEAVLDRINKDFFLRGK